MKPYQTLRIPAAVVSVIPCRRL